MRYIDKGNLHLAFHAVNNACIKYIREEYGIKTLKEVFRRVAQCVYRDVYRHLKNGEAKALVEYWDYYLEREKADYTIEEKGDEIILRINKCPAIAYLNEHSIVPDPAFCEQTKVVNDAFSEGTQFSITTEILREGKCIQTVRRVQSDPK